ncbi:FkbM family methyltransferase [Candidatus Nitrosacidococcus tergens]|uniref:Methyltransferase FkbM family n=1 Tax=Candidatus Nitrosacidococcus tergens TaxID=553981 RepID=A0A7G1Q7F7_9GAMM|nr:FkbM family methyltransferase [Candidatus Nitrosacidococcus tergens]CAB1274476.1 Methyltransferase FkbM family [Candidatus Nitrosacidococcus tergens]
MKILRIITTIIKHPLNKGGRIKGIARFLLWQIGTRLIKRPVVVNYVNNSRLIVQRSMRAATGHIYYGLMEFVEMSFILHFLKKDDLIIDVGANIGSYSIIAGSLDARCISFEPIPNTYKHLKDNIAINSFQDKVQCYNMGLGDTNGNLFFTSSLGPTNKVVGEQSVADIPTVLVRVCKLDDFIEDSKPTAIKIDVEGFEENVLKGASETLNSDSLLVVIIETFGSPKFDSLMLGYGFKPFTYSPFERQLIPITNDYPKKIFNNTIYIKNIDEVHNRIKNAPKFRVLEKEI